MAIKSNHLAYLLATLALAWGVPGQAADPAPEDGIVVGAATDALLAMQAEGTNAGNMQPVSGEEATRSYKRYLDSFSKPMPEFREATGSTMGSATGTSR